MKIDVSLAVLALSLFASTGHAADCAYTADSGFDLDETQVIALYDCVKEAMAEGYASQGDNVGQSYRDWTVTSTRPAVAGAHSERLLQTFANSIAAPQYLKFEDEGVTMPVGSVLAKESVTLSTKQKAARPGPLFIMTKLAEGAAPETNNWRYDGLQPNGKPMKFTQAFCHDCHGAFEAQDAMAYPLEEVRVGQ